MNILWTAASLVLTRCFAVYTQAQTQRTMLQQQMTSSLYDKMQDSQEGVISVITEVSSTPHSHLPLSPLSHFHSPTSPQSPQ